MKKRRKTHEDTTTSKVSAMDTNATNTFKKHLSKSAVRTDETGKVLIKHPLLGSLLFILVCLAFVVASLFTMQLGEIAYTIVGIVGVVFFGGGGLLFVIVMMRKPIVIISNEGITVPYGWGENFVTWENIVKIEVVEQPVARTTQKYIGIFVFDRQGITGAGEKSQAITQKVTGWKNAPALLINLNFTFLNVEYIAGILQELHDKHKGAQSAL